jgi:hypothetical protein
MTELLPYLAGAVVVLLWIRVEHFLRQITDLQSQLSDLRRELGFKPALSIDPSERVRSLAGDPRRTVEAIKAYREESGADVRLAKQVVERLRRQGSVA